MNTRPGRRLAVYGAIVATCTVLLFPLYWMIVTALQPRPKLRVFPPQFLPNPPNWSVFSDLLTKLPFALWVWNTALIALGTMVLSLSVSVLAAYALSRFRLRGGQGLGLFILTSQMLPATLLVIPLFVIFRQTNLIGSPWSVILSQATMVIPFATWMMKGYFDTIPIELEQAALVDGCPPLQAIFRIVLPVAAPGLAATALYSFVISWSDYLFARTFLVTSRSSWTVSMGIASLEGEHSTDWNVVMAASLLSAVPIIIVYLLLERHLVGGLASGAEK